LLVPVAVVVVSAFMLAVMIAFVRMLAFACSVFMRLLRAFGSAFDVCIVLGIGMGVSRSGVMRGNGVFFCRRLAAYSFLTPACAAVAVTVAPMAASAAVIAVIVVIALGALVVFDQRLPISNRDLIIVRMDFGEGQESVAVAAIVDEGSLQRRLYARHLGKIDISSKLLPVSRLEVEFFDAIATQNDHPGFLRMGRIDKHFVGH
jgi:hypothetical protein